MKIAIAIIVNQSQDILITQRASNVHYGGYWEFPGGKIEKNEMPRLAVIRELKEELNIDALKILDLGRVLDEHEFHLFVINRYNGELKLLANQMNYQWVSYSHLNQFLFPPSNFKFFTIIEEYLQNLV